MDGKSGQIAAGDPPLVVLLGEDCPDEPPERSLVRENTLPHIAYAQIQRAQWRVPRQNSLAISVGQPLWAAPGQSSRDSTDPATEIPYGQCFTKSSKV